MNAQQVLRSLHTCTSMGGHPTPCSQYTQYNMTANAPTTPHLVPNFIAANKATILQLSVRVICNLLEAHVPSFSYGMRYAVQ